MMLWHLLLAQAAPRVVLPTAIDDAPRAKAALERFYTEADAQGLLSEFEIERVECPGRAALGKCSVIATLPERACTSLAGPGLAISRFTDDNGKEVCVGLAAARGTPISGAILFGDPLKGSWPTAGQPDRKQGDNTGCGLSDGPTPVWLTPSQCRDWGLWPWAERRTDVDDEPVDWVADGEDAGAVEDALPGMPGVVRRRIHPIAIQYQDQGEGSRATLNDATERARYVYSTLTSVVDFFKSAGTYPLAEIGVLEVRFPLLRRGPCSAYVALGTSKPGHVVVKVTGAVDTCPRSVLAHELAHVVQLSNVGGPLAAVPEQPDLLRARTGEHHPLEVLAFAEATADYVAFAATEGNAMKGMGVPPAAGKRHHDASGHDGFRNPCDPAVLERDLSDLETPSADFVLDGKERPKVYDILPREERVLLDAAGMCTDEPPPSPLDAVIAELVAGRPSVLTSQAARDMEHTLSTPTIWTRATFCRAAVRLPKLSGIAHTLRIACGLGSGDIQTNVEEVRWRPQESGAKVLEGQIATTDPTELPRPPMPPYGFMVADIRATGGGRFTLAIAPPEASTNDISGLLGLAVPGGEVREVRLVREGLTCTALPPTYVVPHFDTNVAESIVGAPLGADTLHEVLGKGCVARTVVIEGHADRRSTEGHNLKLGAARAEQAAITWLDSELGPRGWPSGAADCESFGEHFADQHTNDPMRLAQDRKAILRIEWMDDPGGSLRSTPAQCRPRASAGSR